MSLVHAITAASPLPASPDQAVFARHVILEFRAMAYSPGAEAGLYEPADSAAAHAMADETDESQRAFQAPLLRSLLPPPMRPVSMARGCG